MLLIFRMIRPAHCTADVGRRYAVMPLLNSTGRLGEDCVGVRPNQPYCADYNDEDHGQHDSVFGDVLALIVLPELAKKLDITMSFRFACVLT